MSSEQKASGILTKLSSLEAFEKIDDYLPEIIKFLETEMCSSDFEVVLKILLKDGIKHFDLDMVQDIFLQDILSLTKKIFSECLESIKCNLDNESSNSFEDTQILLNQLLKVLTDIIDGYSSLLEELVSKKTMIDVSHLYSVPTVIITVAGQAFIHCRDSESMYGDYFSECSKMLSNLFTRSFHVQNLLLTSLDENFIFHADTSHQNTPLLILVLDKSMEMAEIACQVDAGTTAIFLQWKGFVKLTSKHRDNLLHKLDVTKAFRILATTILKFLDSIALTPLTQLDEKKKSYLNHQLKLANFMMKVIIKLCEVFTAYLSDESVTLVFDLLINIHGIDQTAFTSNPELSELFKRYLTVGASPLLSHLIHRTSFIEELKKSCNWVYDSERKERRFAGLLAVLVSLSRKLVRSTDEVQQIWFQEKFINIIIRIVSSYGACTRKMIIVEETESYATLVCTSALLISSMSDDSFRSTESEIFRFLIQQPFYSTLFIQDLLCLLARLTNENVVINWVDWLGSVEKRMCSNPQIPVFHIPILRMRLVNLLSPRSRRARLHSIQPQSSLDSITPNSSLDTFNSLLDWLKHMSDKMVGREGDEEVISSIEESKLICLWECLVNIRSLNLHSHWWNRLLNTLAIATSSCIRHFSKIDRILNAVDLLCDGATDTSSLCIISVIESLPRQWNSTRDDPSCSLKAFQILIKLISSAHPPLVKIYSLEVISLLVKFESVHSCLDATLRKHPELNSIVMDYLSGRAIKHSELDVIDTCDTAPPVKRYRSQSILSPQHDSDSLLQESQRLIEQTKTLLDRQQVLTPRQISLLSEFISQCK